VREIDHNDEYSEAVGLPPKEQTPSGSSTNGNTEDDVQKEPEETNGTSGLYRIKICFPMLMCFKLFKLILRFCVEFGSKLEGSRARGRRELMSQIVTKQGRFHMTNSY